MDAKWLHQNPYQTPTADPDARPPSTFDSMRNIVFSWEKFRLIYNAILLPLGLVVLYFAIASGMALPLVVIGTAGTAVAANLCFCAGPLAEFYVCTLFRKETTPHLRKILFVGGVLFSAAGFAVIALLFRIIALGPP